MKTLLWSTLALAAATLGLYRAAPAAGDAAATAAPPAGPGSLSGIWVKSGFKDLALASLQPWAEADVRKRIQNSQQGDPVPTTLTRCLPGIPLMLLRTGKDTLELTLTIDDPRTFTQRWETKQFFKATPADATLTEYICENNRDAPE